MKEADCDGGRWLPVGEWLDRKNEQRLRTLGTPDIMASVSRAEVLKQRRRKTGPGASHHPDTVPRHRGTA
jgi:hypothetical protein